MKGPTNSTLLELCRQWHGAFDVYRRTWADDDKACETFIAIERRLLETPAATMDELRAEIAVALADDGDGAHLLRKVVEDADRLLR